MNRPPLDALIFGAGLAGSILADTLIRQGKCALVIDEPSQSLCSRTAAGLINPIGGKRLNLVWKADTLIPFAQAYYRSLEERFHKPLFHSRAIARLFATPAEEQIWLIKKKKTDYKNWIAPLDSIPLDPSFENSQGFSIQGSGFLDTSSTLDALRAELIHRDSLLETIFDYGEIDFSETTAVSFRGQKAKVAIFCEGHLATNNPFFSDIPYKPAKGVIGRVRISRPLPSTAILKGKFLIPLDDGTYRVGATYNWKERDDIPDPAGILELEAFLESHFPSEWEWVEKRAGVRPATAGAYPVIGPSPIQENALAFNGFGSKGSMQIPYFAQTLADFICEDIPLCKDALPQRFCKQEQSKPKRWRATDIAKEETLKRVNQGDLVIDATAGNGNDTLWLASKVEKDGTVFAFDIQKSALEKTKVRLKKADQLNQVHLVHAGHEHLIDHIGLDKIGQVSAIVFNLGFLPGGDTNLITLPQSTLEALEQSASLLKPGGLLSVILYPGHEGGHNESQQVVRWAHELDKEHFKVHIVEHPTKHPKSPFPIFIEKC